MQQQVQNFDESKNNQPQALLNYSFLDQSSLDNMANSQLISKFSTCGYIVFSQAHNLPGQSHFTSSSLKLEPRFNFPDKYLGNTLQGYTVRCFDCKDQKYRCVKAAVKSLVNKKKSLKNAFISENFLREQQLLQKISTMKDCPNTICKYIINWESDCFYYFATEYCAGGNLFYYMMNVLHGSLLFQPDWNQQMYMRTYPCRFCPKELTYLRLRVVQKIFAQIVSAVRWLHSKEICHLDLSLENVVVQNGNVLDPQIQLIDFGVAVDFGEEGNNRSSNMDFSKTRFDNEHDPNDKHYRYGENVGKPGYKAFEVRMSDETRRKVRLQEVSARRALAMKQIQMGQSQSKNDELSTEITMCDLLLNCVIGKTYDPFAADVWSLGVILFLLLFCRYPFRHADLDDELFVVILQDRLLPWLVEQKALCWMTVETFDILNQMLKPEYSRIDIDRLSCHPFCGLNNAVVANVHGGHASTNTQSSTQTITSSVGPNVNETAKSQGIYYEENYSKQSKLSERVIPTNNDATVVFSQTSIMPNSNLSKNNFGEEFDHCKLLIDHSVDEYDSLVETPSNIVSDRLLQCKLSQ